MKNVALPFASARPCRCTSCRCSVTVSSHHAVCTACRAGGHDMRSWRALRRERQRLHEGAHAA